MSRYWRIIFVFFVCFVSACTSNSSPILEPTQTLIRATSTGTTIPLTPTITLTPLPRAGDIATATPFVAGAEQDFTLDDDPVAAELIVLAQRRVAESLNLPVRRIELVEVKSYTWLETSLGCPAPDVTYPQQEVDGYRIVLKANDEQFIFHTDFDRVIACDAANEKLPPTPPNEP